MVRGVGMQLSGTWASSTEDAGTKGTKVYTSSTFTVAMRLTAPQNSGHETANIAVSLKERRTEMGPRKFIEGALLWAILSSLHGGPMKNGQRHAIQHFPTNLQRSVVASYQTNG